ncbi:hypothetical protein ACLBXM_06010 [Xanthobacteraceae bacterium A53D]
MPTKQQLDEADRLAKAVDWAKLDAMSDEEIRAHWAWDEDMTWPSDEQLARFKLVVPTKSLKSSPKDSAD